MEWSTLFCRSARDTRTRQFFFNPSINVLIHLAPLKTGYGLSIIFKKAQVGKDQEKAQSEKDSHSKNRDGKKLN